MKTKRAQDASRVELEWYRTRSNHGRGRVTGETRRLLKAGLLTFQPTSMKTWVISLSAKGRAVLDGQTH